ncbi:hypothetical protein [Sorangium sp. So ce117]|uniref:hypothetical protein n=1 Tax=Sorangium sp. So ce117 TaxID=3133277 RepID=UPI003F5D687F
MDEDEQLRESENLDQIVSAAAADAAVHVTDGESVADVRDYGWVLDALSGGVMCALPGASRYIPIEAFR